VDFGVSLAIALMPPFTDDPVVPDDDRAYQGIGLNGASTAKRQFECPLHEFRVAHVSKTGVSKTNPEIFENRANQYRNGASNSTSGKENPITRILNLHP
jgi:hypothetical protein